jgi:hypothetical protein
MLFVVWIPLLVQVLVALRLLGWLAFGRPTSRTGWLLRAALVACYLVATAIGGLWLILPWYTPAIYGGLYLLAMLRSLRRWETLPAFPRTPLRLAGTAVIGALLVFSVALATYILTGWRTPEDAVKLSFPLRNGTYVVVNGGGNELINAHYGTLKGERFLPWRGQSYGVDIEKLNRYGFRARGILPKVLTAYEIFGEPLYAPCAGEVLYAVDGVEEMPPPKMDRQHMAGNHVILQCGSAWIILGHLQKGSVQVAAGQRLAQGQRLGRVGNTGNTGEPHLHIHAQRPGTEQAPLSGEPLPIRFDQGYPVRNARIMALRENDAGADPDTRHGTVMSDRSTGEDR